MSLIAIGLSHRTVPLELLERLAIPEREIAKALHDLHAREHLSEVVVLSTCNRTEIYAMAERFHGAVDDICDFLSSIGHLPADDFADQLYAHYDDQAAAHLFEVASGLDSAVLGESEILGQVRTAWERARAEGTAGTHLNTVFRHAIGVGKRARTETSIGRHVTSVSQAAVALAASELGTLDGRKVLVLGAGEMGEGMASALRAWQVAEIFVVNRTWERAVDLAEAVGGQALPLFELPRALAEVDVLLTSTGATAVMVEHADLEPVMAVRVDRPLLIVDVAVPRDVDPGAADIAGVTLLDMDDLRAFAGQGAEARRREIAKVEAIIEEEVLRHVDETTARLAAPLVSALRQRAEEVRRSELDRTTAKLGELDETQREALDALTRGIIGKLLHEPTVRLKDAAGSPRGERLAEALRDLFDL